MVHFNMKDKCNSVGVSLDWNRPILEFCNRLLEKKFRSGGVETFFLLVKPKFTKHLIYGFKIRIEIKPKI